MNLWTISLFDPTPFDGVDLRYTQIAREAVRKNHSVTHFTSTFRHPKKKYRFDEDTVLEIEKGYSIVYLHSKGYKKNISLERLFAHKDFANVLLDNLKSRETPDAILISMPPLSSANRVTEWASGNDIPVIVDIIDPWPDSFIKDVPSGLRKPGKLLISPFYSQLKNILSNCSALTSISNGYLEWALEHTDKKIRKQCFYPALNLNKVQQKIKQAAKTSKRDEDILRIIYAGSLGSSYDIPSILKAAEICEKKYPGKTEFIIAGTGPQSDMVEEKSKSLNNLNYVGWVEENELMKHYYLSDLGLIQHMDNLTQTVTYKLFSYLSAGLPILNSLQSEMVDIISSNKVGLSNMNGDVEKLVSNIEVFLDDREKLEQYKKNAITLTKEKGDSSQVYSDLLRFIEETTQKKRLSEVTV